MVKTAAWLISAVCLLVVVVFCWNHSICQLKDMFYSPLQRSGNHWALTCTCACKSPLTTKCLICSQITLMIHHCGVFGACFCVSDFYFQIQHFLGVRRNVCHNSSLKDRNIDIWVVKPIHEHYKILKEMRQNKCGFAWSST